MPPESGECCGNARTGTIAFAAMGRSYKGAVESRWRSRIHGGIYKGHPPCSYSARQAAAGHRPERRPCPRKRLMQGNASNGTIAFAAMGRSDTGAVESR
jgi:hypothetical protein